MISQYLDAAMRKAHYEMIDDPEPFYGEIRECRGVWATGTTLEECRETLLETLEGWLLLSLQKGLPVSALDGISLAAPEPTEVHG